MIIKKAKLIGKLSWISNWMENYDVLVRNLYVRNCLTLENNVTFNLKETKYWSTYQECIYVWMEISDDVKITVDCYNGDLLEGKPESIRWKAIFNGETKVLVYFEKLIEQHWRLYLENKYKEDELKRKQNRITELERELLV
jgi:hypothetical protein